VGGLADFSMDSNTLAGLQNKYKGRFFGLAQLNLDQDSEKTATDLETAITKLTRLRLRPTRRGCGFVGGRLFRRSEAEPC
jgi:hypothetical protein